MVLCILLLIGLAVVLAVFGREKLPRGVRPKKGMGMFYKAAAGILTFLSKYHALAIDPPAVERLAYVLLVLALGLTLTLLAPLATNTGILVDGYGIGRPEDGKHVRQLQVQAGNDRVEQMKVVVESRRHTEEEQREILEKALAELAEIVPGEAAEEGAHGYLELPETLQEGRVRVQWTKEPNDLLDTEGVVTEEVTDDGALLQLKAELTFEERTSFYECVVTLYPPLYTAEEQWVRSLEREVEQADENSAKEEIQQLPKEVDGEPIVWMEPRSSAVPACLFLTVVAAVFSWMGMEQEQKKRKELRTRQMALDYPDLLFKLSMLFCAGLTMKNAFFKIAKEYRDRKKQGVRYAYEEMLVACYEMNSGVPEARAYENFGRRCGGNGYIKLGSLLSSNLQKGSEGLAQILQEEAQLAMEERRQMARKFGEEAGTKLLMPMMLMLLVVMAILIAPAMFSF